MGRAGQTSLKITPMGVGVWEVGEHIPIAFGTRPLTLPFSHAPTPYSPHEPLCAMSAVVRLSLRPDEDAKVTPLEVLRDFADVRTGWGYLEEDSRHYAELKGTPGAILRHRTDPSTYVDLGFAGAVPDSNTLDLAVLDRPGSDAPLSSDERAALIDTFLDAMRDYLSARPDHVALHVERDPADSAAE